MIVAQLIINSLLYGGLLGVAALGLSLVFGVMRIINFAHGELVTIGAYATWLLVQVGVSPLLALPVAFLVGAVLGAAIDRALVTPLSRRPELDMLIGTYGLSVLAVGVLTQVFTGDLRSFSAGPSGSFAFAGLVVGLRSLTVLLVCLVLVGGTVLFMQRTRLGIGMRALAQNADSAAACGVNVVASRTLVLALASALAAAAGSLVSLVGTVSPTVGQDWLLNSLVVVVLGGMGSIVGTLVAAVLIGLVRSVGSFVLDDTWALILSYAMLYVALVWRPQGLLGRAAAAR